MENPSQQPEVMYMEKIEWKQGLSDEELGKYSLNSILTAERNKSDYMRNVARKNIKKVMQKLWDTAENRFWKVVDKKDKNDCWYSKSYRISTGKTLDNGKREFKSMQRFSLELHKKFSKKPCVIAKCGNNNCVNPNHLYYATKTEAGKAGGSKRDKVFSKKVANESRNKQIAKEYKMYVKKNKTKYGALKVLSKKYNLKKAVLSTIVKKYS